VLDSTGNGRKNNLFLFRIDVRDSAIGFLFGFTVIDRNDNGNFVDTYSENS
jgi:hypothetical protein